MVWVTEKGFFRNEACCDNLDSRLAVNLSVSTLCFAWCIDRKRWTESPASHLFPYYFENKSKNDKSQLTRNPIDSACPLYSEENSCVCVQERLH